MSLNIKNERVHDLAREAARLTGQSQTSVIEQALRHLLDELEKGSRAVRAEEILGAIQADMAQRPPLDPNFLYDEDGLPA